MKKTLAIWLDRQITAATEDFESFEIDVMGTTVALEIPEIKGVDDLVAYADFINHTAKMSE